jgi:hypothetical protein
MLGVAVAGGWAVNHFGPVLGLDPRVAWVLAWLVGLVIAIGFSLLLKPRNRKRNESEQQFPSIEVSPQISPAISPVISQHVEAPKYEAPKYEAPRIDIKIDNTSSSHQSQAQSQQQSAFVPPRIDAHPALMRESFVTLSGEVTNQPKFFDEENRKLPVAFAPLYRGADRSTEPFVDVRGHITFLDENGTQVFRINDAWWYRSQRHHATFEPGDSRRFVVAIIETGSVVPYEGRFKSLETTYVSNEKFFCLENTERLEGNRFHVVIDWIGTRGGLTTTDGSADYDLVVNPPSFTLRRS